MASLASLTIVRHGRSVANEAFAAAQAAGSVEAALVGRDRDVELAPLGIRQAQTIGRHLASRPADLRPEVVVASAYRRAQQTWQVAVNEAAQLGVQLPDATLDERLIDRRMGVLELLHDAAIEARFPEEAERQRTAGWFDYRPVGGESMVDVGVRQRHILAELTASYADRRVLLVAHDAVVMMMRYVIEDLTVEQLEAMTPVANGSFTDYRSADGRLELVAYNRVIT